MGYNSVTLGKSMNYEVASKVEPGSTNTIADHITSVGAPMSGKTILTKDLTISGWLQTNFVEFSKSGSSLQIFQLMKDQSLPKLPSPPLTREIARERKGRKDLRRFRKAQEARTSSHDSFRITKFKMAANTVRPGAGGWPRSRSSSNASKYIPAVGGALVEKTIRL